MSRRPWGRLEGSLSSSVFRRPQGDEEQTALIRSSRVVTIQFCSHIQVHLSLHSFSHAFIHSFIHTPSCLHSKPLLALGSHQQDRARWAELLRLGGGACLCFDSSHIGSTLFPVPWRTYQAASLTLCLRHVISFAWSPAVDSALVPTRHAGHLSSPLHIHTHEAQSPLWLPMTVRA